MTRARDIANSRQEAPGTAGQPFIMAGGSWSGTCGTFSATYGVTLYVGQVSVTFPAGRFTQAPMVTQSTGAGSGYGGVPVFPSVGFVTSSGFTSQATNTYGSITPCTVYWQAIQMTSSSGAG